MHDRDAPFEAPTADAPAPASTSAPPSPAPVFPATDVVATGAIPPPMPNWEEASWPPLRPPPQFNLPGSPPLRPPYPEYIPPLPPSSLPPPLPFHKSVFQRVTDFINSYASAEIGFWHVLFPLVLLSVVLYTRLPTTNYIFDEQEALLANPYVNKLQGLRFIDAIHRDFWGLAPDRSVGSYRPIPDMLWRLLWMISKQPFFHHFYNVLFHALNGTLLTLVAHRLTQRRDIAWLAGSIFVASALLTEAVSGIVGIADVLGGMGALLALAALFAPMYAMPAAVFASVLFGLFCKESALVCVPLVPFAALVLAPLTHRPRPLRLLRAFLALVAAAGAFVLYVELRRRWFPSPLPHELDVPLPDDAKPAQVFFRKFLVWFHQAPLPKDPLNNPFANADRDHRIAGALRVYWRGLTQVVFPKTLSGDYSYPQEDVPTALLFPESLAGAAMVALPLLLGPLLWVAALFREMNRSGRGSEANTGAQVQAKAERSEGFAMNRSGRGSEANAGAQVQAKAERSEGRALKAPRDAETPIGSNRYPALGISGAAIVAVGLVWIVVSYFPHSNIPVVLPTVRAERFWYFPVIGSSLILAVLFAWLDDLTRSKQKGWFAPALFGAFFAFQCAAAYRHAMDYRDDVTFWEATKNAVPFSAKAHLNFSVMKGARGELAVRLAESKIAIDLAPNWPMARVYTGDALCRLHRPDDAWLYYKEGFERGPNELSLIALALQCMWDEKALMQHEDELRTLAYEERFKGTWIAYLAIDTLDNGEQNKGVDPKYRPRGYNEGAKDSSTQSECELGAPTRIAREPAAGVDSVPRRRHSPAD